MYELTIKFENYDDLNRQLQELMVNAAPIIKSEKSILEEIENRKVNIGYRKKKAWTEFEKNFLLDNYKSKSTEWLAQKLNRPKNAIDQMLYKMYKELGIPKRIKRAKNI